QRVPGIMTLANLKCHPGRPRGGRSGTQLAAYAEKMVAPDLHGHPVANWNAGMRPNLLDPFFVSITSLSGVGPKLEQLFRRLIGRDDLAPRILDLLFHLPTGAIDRRARPKLRDIELGTVVTVAVTVDLHRPTPPNRPRAPYQIYVSDDTSHLIL